jgi:hypothetical protein
MKKVLVRQDIMLIGLLENILKNASIACFVKNRFLNGAAGELPPTECWPELWVENDADYKEAKELLTAYLTAPAPQQTAWTCSNCNEWLDGQFTTCWLCGQDRPQD